MSRMHGEIACYLTYSGLEVVLRTLYHKCIFNLVAHSKPTCENSLIIAHYPGSWLPFFACKTRGKPVTPVPPSPRFLPAFGCEA